MLRNKKIISFIVLVLLLLTTIFVSANSGSIKAGVYELVVGIFNNKYANVNAIVDVRFPRIIITILVGAALGVSGLLLQTVLKNPLVDPSIIGVSSGANLFLYLGIGLFPQLLMFKTVFSIIGGIIGFIIIYYLAGHTKNNVKIILIGIAISYFFTGILSSIQYITQSSPSTSSAAKTVSLGTKNWEDVRLLLIWIPALLIISLFLAKLCNIFTLDDNIIASLGININNIRLLISFVAVALASVATAVAGVLVFLALIVPHIAKIIIGRNHLYTIPFSAVLGAFVLLLFDTLGRVVFAPVEIPADLIMMIIGGPAFIILVKRGVN
ncbi:MULTISPECIES: FecCD family ABC transporter permease [Gemella]|uniref:FecCD family ABC transporter permease n=1 Tax=Gemella TaxID=1378 RepID=UPI0007683D83|nr:MULTISPECIES: iron ABC transporter permease [Gemella]AME09067.1 iron ABC transporter permease [Gemella sp. oral taxon 928]